MLRNREQSSGREKRNGDAGRCSYRRYLAPVFIGLAGAVVIWVVTPYNNYVIAGSDLGGGYLPVLPLFITLILVLGINPLFRWLRPGWVLDTGQLATVVGILMVASILPGQGLLRMLPHAIAKVPLAVRDNARLAEAYEQMDLPAGLFPDKIGFGQEAPAAYHFITELPPGESIPWSNWLAPLLSWGVFLIFCWLMMAGLSMIVLPQWRRNERLAFPLLTVMGSLIKDPEKGNLFSEIFKSRPFWIAAVTVFVLHLLDGAKVYNPESIPAIPLSWNLRSLFTEEPLRHLPSYIYVNRISFIFIGVAFFMPNRAAFSIWFFQLAYAIYQMIGRAYLPPFYLGKIADHRMGAMLALTVGIVWVGRAHWAEVFRSLFKDPRSEEQQHRRKSGRVFLAGCAGMFGWLLWVGAEPLWALFYVGFAFMVSLLITRIVSETGMPFIRIDCRYHISLVKLAPVSWVGPASLYLSFVIAMLFPTASTANFATMSTHALGLDEKSSLARRYRLAILFVVVLVMGLVICGSMHLKAAYRNSMTLDGRLQPIAPWGTQRLDYANRALLEHQAGQLSHPPYNQIGHIAFGAGLAGVLQWACLVMPKWPLHPIGLLMVYTYFSYWSCASIFLGWLVKVLLLHYGGARVYQRARPVFLGLIMGGVFANVFWAFVPSVLVFLGKSYLQVRV